MGKEKKMTTRRIVVLELLRDHNDPMRRIDLYNKANQDEDFRKVSGQPFWVEDFSWFMKDLISAGQVKKIKERGKVWYIITEIGLNYLLKEVSPETLRQTTMRRLRYYVGKRFGYADWSKDEWTAPIEAKITELVSQMDDGDKYVQKRYYAELVNRNAYRRDWGRTEIDKDELELVEQKIGKIDKEQLEIDIQKQIDRARRRLERRDEYFGECFKCGARIHRRDARKVAIELAERLGVETGTVCCGCYDKLMGGEGEVAEINA